MFNNNRLSLARKRRGLITRALAQQVGLSSVHLSRLERSRRELNKNIIIRLAETLRFPIDFFYADDVEDLDEEAVSFRSSSKMPAKERAAVISVGQLGIELTETDLPDMEGEDPENAAYLRRQHWGIGEQPIGNLISWMN